MRMRVEFALILGIVFFCCWCGYIIVNMNASVTSTTEVINTNHKHDNNFANHRKLQAEQNKTRPRPLLANNSSLEAAIRQLPAGQYVIREAPEYPGAQLSPPSAGRSWARPAADYTSVLPSTNYAQDAYNGASEQSAWPQHAAPPPSQQQLPVLMEPTTNGHLDPDPDGEVNTETQTQDREPTLESPAASEAEAEADNLDEAGQTEGEQLEAAEPEEEAEEAAGEPQSEFEERVGGRSFSEDLASENERGRDGQIVRERRRHLINGRPVDGGQLPSSKSASRHPGRRQNRPVGSDSLRGAASTQVNNELEYVTKTDSGKPQSGRKAELAGSAGDQPANVKPQKGTIMLASPSNLETKSGRASPLARLLSDQQSVNNWPPDGQQTGRMWLPQADQYQTAKEEQNNKSTPDTITKHPSGLEPKAHSRNNNIMNNNNTNNNKIGPNDNNNNEIPADGWRGISIGGNRGGSGGYEREEPEEIDEQSRDLEPERKRNSHEHKVRESLRADSWDDDSKMSPGRSSGTRTEPDSEEPEEGSVETVFRREPGDELEFKDLDLLVDSDKFPFMERRRRRKRFVEPEGIQVRAGSGSDLADGSAQKNVYLRPLVKFDDDDDDNSKRYVGSPPPTTSTQLGGTQNGVLNSTETMLSPIVGGSSAGPSGSDSNELIRTNSLLEPKHDSRENSTTTGLVGAAHTNQTGSPEIKRLDALEDLAIEVLSNGPGQPEGNGSFLISALPEQRPALETQTYYNPIQLGAAGSDPEDNGSSNGQYAASKSKVKKVKYVKKSNSHEAKRKHAKGYKTKKKSKLKKGGVKKKKSHHERKFVKNHKDFKGSTRGKKAKKGHGKKGGKKGKLYYKDKGYKKKGFKKNYQKFETGDHKTYFDEFRDKDHSKKWKDYNDKHHYSQSKKWSGNDKKKYNNYALKASKGKKHGHGSWREKADSKFVKSYKRKKEMEKKLSKMKKKKKKKKP